MITVRIWQISNTTSVGDKKNLKVYLDFSQQQDKIRNNVLSRYQKLRNVKFYGEKFSLGSEQQKSSTICELTPLIQAPGRPACCWQPQTGGFKMQKYLGYIAKTKRFVI